MCAFGDVHLSQIAALLKSEQSLQCLPFIRLCTELFGDVLTHTISVVFCTHKLLVQRSLQVVLGPLIAIALKISNIHERTGRRGPNIIT